MIVATPMLLEGAWYSLEQCGRLLSDAVALYRAGSEATAVGLAMLGREELGKYRSLLESWRESEKTGKCPNVEDVRDACIEHVEKQRKALLSWSFTAEPGSGLDAAIRTQLNHQPQDAEYRQAEQTIRAALKAFSKHAPDERHKLRMRSLYVDLNDSGLSWNRPAQVSLEEARKLLNDAVNDYAGQRDKMDPDLLRELDPELADALEPWQQRPVLPIPIWP